MHEENDEMDGPEVQDLADEIRMQADLEAQAYPPKDDLAADPGPEKGRKFSEIEIQRAMDRNQFGDAELIVKLAHGRFCLDKTSGGWYEFAGHCWREDVLEKIVGLIDEVATEYDREAILQYVQAKQLDGEDQKRRQAFAKELQKRARQLRGYDRIRAVLKCATMGTGSIGMAGEQWDQHPTLLPCANGVIDLETGKLHPGEPGQYMRKASPFEYHGLHEEAPFWDEVLYKVFCGNMELLDYFNKAVVGYGATGLSTFKDFFCAYGPGGDNGKSAVFETIQQALGDFAGTIQVGTLLDEGFVRSASGPTPELLKLRGLRLAVTSEAEQHHKFSMAKIKMICSGGDSITAREPYAKRDVTFRPAHTLVLHTNFLPQAKGNDRAFFNRLRVIPFRALFLRPGDPRNPDPSKHIYQGIPREIMNRELAKEAPGILAYIVRCARDFLKDMNLTPPACVLAETSSYREDEDLVGRFLETCCVVDRDGVGEQMKNIYGAFRRFCEESEGMSPKRLPSQVWLSKDFKGREDVIHKLSSKPVVRYNLRVRDDWWPVEE